MKKDNIFNAVVFHHFPYHYMRIEVQHNFLKVYDFLFSLARNAQIRTKSKIIGFKFSPENLNFVIFFTGKSKHKYLHFILIWFYFLFSRKFNPHTFSLVYIQLSQKRNQLREIVSFHMYAYIFSFFQSFCICKRTIIFMLEKSTFLFKSLANFIQV